ncbi:uncharacterized protein LOC111883784 [Lactuca sativa]|uniref:uncharacterized protein LOC111883784 n=1 Tax=Lactuca sativa TaxID=4236 RepID=UPI000CD8903F|nr:uncharacterized protein LOC111883784 [Lactuca sativa]
MWGKRKRLGNGRETFPGRIGKSRNVSVKFPFFFVLHGLFKSKKANRVMGYTNRYYPTTTSLNRSLPRTGISICKKATTTNKLNVKQLEDAYEEKKAKSHAKEVQLPYEAGVGFKKRKGISAPIKRAFGVEIRDQMDQEIERMFYTRGLPFNLARNPHYLRVFQFAANNKIDGYVPPGYNKLRTTLLQKEKDNVHKILEPLRSTRKEKGVTTVNDGWNDPTRKPLINFMATSDNGPLFLKAVNCFGEIKDKFYIVELMKEVINEIGHQNVVQIITNNATNCKAVGEIIESQFPHIYWTPCVVHTLNLALKNICSPRNVKTNELTYEQCS